MKREGSLLRRESHVGTTSRIQCNRMLEPVGIFLELLILGMFFVEIFNNGAVWHEGSNRLKPRTHEWDGAEKGAACRWQCKAIESARMHYPHNWVYVICPVIEAVVGDGEVQANEAALGPV